MIIRVKFCHFRSDYLIQATICIHFDIFFLIKMHPNHIYVVPCMNKTFFYCIMLHCAMDYMIHPGNKSVQYFQFLLFCYAIPFYIKIYRTEIVMPLKYRREKKTVRTPIYRPLFKKHFFLCINMTKKKRENRDGTILRSLYMMVGIPLFSIQN